MPASQSYAVTIEVAVPPRRVFECVSDTWRWWGGRDLEGNTTQLHEEFTITHGTVHYSKQRVIQVIPDRRVVWLVTDSRLTWLERNQHEWTNTKLVIDILVSGESTVLRFTHEGLVPEMECYARCSEEGWNVVIKKWLFEFITEGRPHFG